MWALIKKVAWDCISENDGTSACPVRVFGCGFAGLAIPVFLSGAVQAIGDGQFHMQEFATSFATIMGGLGLLGAGIAAKAFTDKP